MPHSGSGKTVITVVITVESVAPRAQHGPGCPTIKHLQRAVKRRSQGAGQSHLTPLGVTVAPAQAGVQAPALDSGLRRKDELDHSNSDHLGSNCWTP